LGLKGEDGRFGGEKKKFGPSPERGFPVGGPPYTKRGETMQKKKRYIAEETI